MTATELRPYEPLGMTTAKWREIPPEPVYVADLVPSQDGITLAGLVAHAADGGTASWCGDVFLHVVEHAGRLYLVDGHHRYGVALVRRTERVLARVFRPSASSPDTG